MEILELYKSLLRAGSMTVDSEGCVSGTFQSQSVPAMVDGKRLVLPTKEQLSNPNWDNRVAFHPLSENILRGESPVLEALRKALNIRINFVFSALAYELLTIAASPAQHSKLNPDQASFLTQVVDADEKSLAFLKKFLEAMPIGNVSKCFVSIYLKRGGTVAAKRHARVGVVTFPAFTELKSTEPKPYGIKPSSAKVRETAIALLNYMIPNMEAPEEYHHGSDSRVAPYLEALMRAFMNIAVPLNDLIETFRDQLHEPDALLLESDWVEAFEDLSKFNGKIPSLKGNEGNPAPGDAEPVAAPAPVAQAPYQQPASAPYQQAPAPSYAAPAPAPVNDGGGISFADLARSNPGMGYQHQPVNNYQQPQHYPQNNYSQPYNNGGYNNHPGVMPGSTTVIGGTDWTRPQQHQQHQQSHQPQQHYQHQGYRPSI